MTNCLCQCKVRRLLISFVVLVVIAVRVQAGDETDAPGPIISLPGHTGAVLCIAFSPDGRLAVTHGGLGDHAIHIWDIAGRKEAGKQAHEECNGNSVLWASGGKLILSGGDGGRGSGAVMLQDPRTGKRVGGLIKHDSVVISVALSADGKKMASADVQGSVRVWDFKNGTQLREFKHSAGVNSIVFSRDGALLLTGSDDKVIRLWNIEKDRQEREFKGHNAVVGAVAFSADGKRAYSASFSPLNDTDGTVRVWQVDSGKELDKIEVGSETSILRSIAFSADRKRILTGHSNGEVNLWDVESKMKQTTFTKHKHPVTAVAFSPDGRLALSGEDCQGGSEMWLYRLPK